MGLCCHSLKSMAPGVAFTPLLAGKVIRGPREVFHLTVWLLRPPTLTMDYRAQDRSLASRIPHPWLSTIEGQFLSMVP